MSGKIIFERQPQVSVYQLLAYRAILSTAVNALIINVEWRRKLWDAVPRDQWSSLLTRIVQQNATIFITFHLIKNFELTTVSIVNNSSTLLTVVAGYLILGENKTSMATWMALLIGFAATITFVVSENAKGQQLLHS